MARIMIHHATQARRTRTNHQPKRLTTAISPDPAEIRPDGKSRKDVASTKGKQNQKN